MISDIELLYPCDWILKIPACICFIGVAVWKLTEYGNACIIVRKNCCCTKVINILFNCTKNVCVIIMCSYCNDNYYLFGILPIIYYQAVGLYSIHIQYNSSDAKFLKKSMSLLSVCDASYTLQYSR